MNRRMFITSGALGSLVTLHTRLSAQDPHTYTESARDIPIVDTFDVIVCGAGPAGVCAAIEAGRTGAKTLLLESQGCLGGIWTAGLLCWILDGYQKGGLVKEIYERLENENAGFPDRGGNRAFAYDAETMKWLLEDLCREANVHIRYHTAVSATRVKDSQIDLVITESKSGRQAWKGKVFIDCTGDGDVAARAGCGFDYGRPGDQAAQPMSLLGLVTGVHYDEIESFVRRKDESGGATKARLLKEIERGGYSPSYKKPGIYPIYDDLFMLMANHQYGYSPLKAGEVTEATMHARAELYRIIRSLRSLGGQWSGLRLVATAEQIGIREGRRIHGLYTVTSEDLVRGAEFEDAVCRVSFGVDVHSVQQEDETKSYNQGIRSKDYDIPLRSLIARDVNGLMMAGRCISGDFIAHSSYRVTGNAAAMGQAAGRVAALAAGRRVLPQHIPFKETGIQN